jgi:hypothetical protein
MDLHETLNLCQGDRSHEWVEIPGDFGRPATAMVAGVFDAGMEEASMRPLAGHSLAVYEPDPRLSLVWPVPDEPEAERRRDGLGTVLPEWVEQDTHDWKHARPGWAVVLLCGSPIWQELVWYLDWGSGIGGYTANIQPVFGDSDEDGTPQIARWETTTWAVGLADLISQFSVATDFFKFDPTNRLVPKPSNVHPIDAERERSM